MLGFRIPQPAGREREGASWDYLSSALVAGEDTDDEHLLSTWRTAAAVGERGNARWVNRERKGNAGVGGKQRKEGGGSRLGGGGVGDKKRRGGEGKVRGGNEERAVLTRAGGGVPPSLSSVAVIVGRGGVLIWSLEGWVGGGPPVQSSQRDRSCLFSTNKIKKIQNFYQIESYGTMH